MIRTLCIVFIGLLPLWLHAKDRPPNFRVTNIEFRKVARLDGEIVNLCDVPRLVTDAIQANRKNSKSSATMDLVLRIDRVAKIGGRPPPNPSMGGVELGITVITAGSKEINQPFVCRTEAKLTAVKAAQCARVERCGDKIADQISTWMSWQTR